MMSCLHLLVLHLYLSHLTLSLFPASSSACPLHYTHEPPLGCSSFSPVLQLHIQHHLSSKVTIFHLHMSKPSQPDLSNFICLFVCFCLFTVILYLFVVILPFSVPHLAVLHLFDVFLPPWFPFHCTFSQVLPLRATGGGTHPDRLSSGRPNPFPRGAFWDFM